jgi:hypothetical protein
VCSSSQSPTPPRPGVAHELDTDTSTQLGRDLRLIASVTPVGLQLDAERSMRGACSDSIVRECREDFEAERLTSLNLFLAPSVSRTPAVGRQRAVGPSGGPSGAVGSGGRPSRLGSPERTRDPPNALADRGAVAFGSLPSGVVPRVRSRRVGVARSPVRRGARRVSGDRKTDATRHRSGTLDTWLQRYEHSPRVQRGQVELTRQRRTLNAPFSPRATLARRGRR